MLDPHMDADALYRLASDTSLLNPEIIEEIARHHSCYPALASWAQFASTGVDLSLVPVPTPPKPHRVSDTTIRVRTPTIRVIAVA